MNLSRGHLYPLKTPLKAERESWQSFIFTLNPNTPAHHIGNAISKTQGKKIKQLLETSNSIITDQSEVDNTIAQIKSFFVIKYNFTGFVFYICISEICYLASKL